MASAAVLAMTAGSLLTAAPAQAAQSCRATASAPTYQAGTIVYSGGVTCSQQATEISITVILEMDGNEVADTANSCIFTYSCYDTGLYPNRSGNQRWCTRVTATN